MVDQRWEQPGHDRVPGNEPGQGEDPEQAVEETEQRPPCDENRRVRDDPPAGLLGEQPRRTHVHQEGLQLALVPAAPLLDPVDRVRVGFRKGRGVECPDPVPGPAQPDAEIGIIGRVPRVPRPGGPECGHPEMTGGASQRNGGGCVDQTGKQVAETNLLFQREPAGQQVPGRAVETETGLHAGVTRTQPFQGHDGLAQLERIGPVLRVEHRAEHPSRGQEAVVAGLRFRPGIGPGHPDHAQVRPGTQGFGGGDGPGVTGLHQEPDVQLVPGVVNAFEGFDQFLHLRFTEHRDQHGVGGQPALRDRAGLLVGDPHHPSAPRATPEHQQTEHERPELEGGQQPDQHHPGGAGQENQPGQGRNDSRHQEQPLPADQDDTGRVRGGSALQGVAGHVEGPVRGHEGRIGKRGRGFPGRDERTPVECALRWRGGHDITPILDETATRTSSTPTAT